MGKRNNAECDNSFGKTPKLDNTENAELLGRSVSVNDVSIMEGSCSRRPATASASKDNGGIEPTATSQNNRTEEAVMEDARPGTSSNNTSTTNLISLASSNFNMDLFSESNYRASLSPTSSTPELRAEHNSSGSTDASNREIEDNEYINADDEEDDVRDYNGNDDVVDDAVIEDDIVDDDIVDEAIVADNVVDDDILDDNIVDDDVVDDYVADHDNDLANTESEESLKKLIMNKPKPDYNWSLIHEMMHRENGLSSRGRKTAFGRSSLSFQRRVYGARHTIEKLELLHCLIEHDDDINCLNFNKAGTLLASGSDNFKINLWDWSSNKVKYSFNSGHTSQVLQAKFIELGGVNDLNLVSSDLDGQIRYTSIPPDGGSLLGTTSRILLKHSGSVHKISPSPQNPYEILTACEGGYVVRYDLRENKIERVVTVKVNKRNMPLYSIAHNPLHPQFCVSGCDQFIRVFDERSTKTPLFMMCPQHLIDVNSSFRISCAVYNSTGTEILGSYNNDDIYSFDSKLYTSGGYTHRYCGHKKVWPKYLLSDFNVSFTYNKIIKGVSYFGLNSEYVVSGSNCGNLFIWDKSTEAILNWQQAGFPGIISCLEPHPYFPILATSGLDNAVQIWAPTNANFSPDMQGLGECIKKNMKRGMNATDKWFGVEVESSSSDDNDDNDEDDDHDEW